MLSAILFGLAKLTAILFLIIIDAALMGYICKAVSEARAARKAEKESGIVGHESTD